MGEKKNTTATKTYEEAKENHPHLIPLFELEQEIWSLQDKTRGEIESKAGKTISPSTVREKIVRGEPLIHLADLEVDWEAFSLLLQKMSEVLIKHSSETRELVEDFNARFTTRELLLEVTNSEVEEKDEFAQFLVGNVLKPFLEKEREALLPLVDQELWIRRYCPVCGGKPDFSLLEDDVGIRSLICGRCNARWKYKRLECPFCGTEDTSKLAYYPSEDKAYRLYVCDNCKYYLKAIDLRVKLGEPDMRLERLVTLDLDIAAQEAGYI